MKKLNEEQIVKKWGPMLEQYGIPVENLNTMCTYAEFHALIESEVPFGMQNMDLYDRNQMKNLLPVSIKILTKVKDLSKIHPVPVPFFQFMKKDQICSESVKTHSLSFNIDREDIVKMISGVEPGLEMMSALEDTISNKVSEHFNKLIDEGNEIHLFLALSSIRMITSGSITLGTTDQPMVQLLSRYHAEPTSVTVDDL